MEELRSTDILDKEITADARKKAERVLERAEAEGKAALDGVAARIAAVKKEKSAECQARIDAFQKNMDASLPLEKERFRVSFVESAIAQGLNEYFKSLPKERRLEMAAARWKKCAPSFALKKIRALVFGFSPEEAREALEKAGAKVESCDADDGGRDDDSRTALSPREGIILVSDDGAVRARLTLSQIALELEDSHRAELAGALFNGGLSQWT